MPRPIWTGSISFGLVNIPIRLVSAIESHRVGFHELEEGTGERIRYKRVAEGSGHEVAWDHIQKGFAVGKDRFVVLSDEEVAAAEPERTHTVDIQQFVGLAEIDPLSFGAAYYAAPDGAAAGKPYVLLRDAMHKEDRVAVGRFVMRTKEYVACIRPLGRVLVLHTMYFADEIRRPEAVADLPARTTVSARELAMAAELISSLSGPWKPREYQDTFRQSVLALVKKKERGETIETGAARPKAARVVDLMEALKATLEQGPKGPAPARRTAASTRTQARERSHVKGRPRRRAAKHGDRS
ncbi:MAG TPA: Ku protein [Polyangia bacterium]|jgi:DNA end-binding protein Ku